jgi:stringent starvation protein B
MSLPDKKDVTRALLLRGNTFVHFDPRKDNIRIPIRLRLQAQVVIQIGLDMPVPIPDLRVDDEGIYGTLSFKGDPFTCFIPWSAIFAVVGEDARGMVWNAEMPSEIAAEVAREKDKASKPKPLSNVTPLNTRGISSRPAGTIKHDRSSANRPSHLRLVK